MRVRVPAFAFFLLLTAAPLGAQVDNNSVDVSGGYALGRGNGIAASGWYGDTAGRVHGPLYVVGLISGTYDSESATVQGTTLNVSLSRYDFAVGPRVFLRSHDIASPFVDAVLGGFHARVDAGILGTFGSASVTGFALTLGAGADFRISETFSLRLKPGWTHSRAEEASANRFVFLAGIAMHLGL